VQDWFDVSGTESFFAGGISGFSGPDEGQAMFLPALDALYASGHDFGPLDSGGWGTLDHLVVIHSGYGAEYGDPVGNEGCTLNTEKDRLWSRGLPASLYGWQSPDGFYSVSNYAYAGAFDPPFCEFKPANMGILTHEFMHGFNLIDLYDQDVDEAPIYLGGLGRYDIMSSTWGWNRNIAIPGHMSPFSRAAVGWIEPIEITTDGTYLIQASEFSNQVYVIKQNFPAGEYLYIENRQPVKWCVQRVMTISATSGLSDPCNRRPELGSGCSNFDS
jgi:M6 family metalloprotease-like protein